MTEPTQDDAAAPAGWLRWAPLLVVLAAWVAHAGARQATWVLDDSRLVRDNTLVARGPAAVPHIVAGRGDTEMTERYGPLTVASLALEAPLWRQSDNTLAPAGFHLTNLLLHGLCALLLFRLLLGLFGGRPIAALAGALLFAVHPLHTGTVATLMGRAHLLATLFALLTVFAWRAWAQRRAAWLPVAALAWLAALGASPVALGLPLVLFLLDLAVPPRGEEPRVPGARFGILVFAVPFVVFLVTWGGVPTVALDLPYQSALDRIGIGFEGLARMLLALVIPVGLRGDHTDEALPGTGYEVGTLGVVLTALAALLVLLALARAGRGRAGPFSVAWLATVALALPAFLALPAGAPLESSFAYLVALPLCAAGGLVLRGLFLAGRSDTSTSFALARGGLLAVFALTALVGLTHREALGWRDDASFHERLLERNPQHVRAMVRLAATRRHAASELRMTAAALPVNSPLRNASLEQRREAIEEARAWARRAVRHLRGRRSPYAWREMGLTLMAADKIAPALRALERALALDPQLSKPPKELLADAVPARQRLAAETWYAIGRCRASLGRREKAADALLHAWQLDEDDLTYMRAAGSALCRVLRYAEGLPLLLEVRRRTPDPKARKELDDVIESARRSARDLAERLVREGEAKQAENTDAAMREAVKLYERALQVNPASPRALIRAGFLRGWWFGAYEVAEERFRQAEALLRRGGVPESDPDWRQLASYREILAKQKAEEEEEERREAKDGG